VRGLSGPQCGRLPVGAAFGGRKQAAGQTELPPAENATDSRTEGLLSPFSGSRFVFCESFSMGAAP